MRLGVAPRHNRLFARMLVMLAEDGVLRRSEAWFTVVTALPSVGLPAEGIAEAGELGVLDAELMMLSVAGPHFRACSPASRMRCHCCLLGVRLKKPASYM